MREWLRETHGPDSELLRHFLLRFFDSDMVTAPGQTATALIGAFSIFLPWFPPIVGPLRHKYAYFPASRYPGRTAGGSRGRTVADYFNDVGDRTVDGRQVAIAVSGVARLSCARSLPLRARQIFAAKLLALLVLATAAVVTFNLLPALMFPASR